MADYNPNQFDRDALQGIAPNRLMATEADKRLDMLRQLIDAEQAAEDRKARYKKVQAEFREVEEELEKLYATQRELCRDLGIALGFSDGSEKCSPTEVGR